MSALAEGLLDDKVTKKTFLDIAKRLLETAHRELPSADAIRGISSGATPPTLYNFCKDTPLTLQNTHRSGPHLPNWLHHLRR
jgi:hypothetical protein